MATTKADLYANEGITRAMRSLRLYLPSRLRQPNTDNADLVSNALADLQHWCDAHGLQWDDALHQAEAKYQRDRAGRPAGDDDARNAGCARCTMVGAACEFHQNRVPGR